MTHFVQSIRDLEPQTGSSAGVSRCLAEFRTVSMSEPLQMIGIRRSSTSTRCITLVVSRLQQVSVMLFVDERTREEVEWEAEKTKEWWSDVRAWTRMSQSNSRHNSRQEVSNTARQRREKQNAPGIIGSGQVPGKLRKIWKYAKYVVNIQRKTDKQCR